MQACGAWGGEVDKHLESWQPSCRLAFPADSNGAITLNGAGTPFYARSPRTRSVVINFVLAANPHRGVFLEAWDVQER